MLSAHSLFSLTCGHRYLIVKQGVPTAKVRDDQKVDMLNLFGSDDEEGSDDSGGDGMPKWGPKGGRRGAKGTSRKGKGGRKRAVGSAAEDDAEDAEEDVEEDIYDGEADELRPEKPEPAEDWEHEQVTGQGEEVWI